MSNQKLHTSAHFNNYSVLTFCYCNGVHFCWQIFITILDDNDNQPLFPQPLYSWEISEGSLPGQAFIDVAASDIDLTTNAEIDYSIIAGNTGSKLSIVWAKNWTAVIHNPLLCEDAFEATPEGHIRAATTLDRETLDFYSLTVMSLDRGVPALMHMTTVDITVTDINDNTPIIMPFLTTTEVTEVTTYYIIWLFRYSIALCY